MALTIDQIKYQLERIDKILNNMTIPEEDRIILQQQQESLTAQLEKLEPKKVEEKEVVQEIPFDNAYDCNECKNQEVCEDGGMRDTGCIFEQKTNNDEETPMEEQITIEETITESTEEVIPEQEEIPAEPTEKTYEEKVDEFINNIKVDVDVPEVNDEGEITYLSELMHNIEDYQKRMDSQKVVIESNIEAQKVLITLITNYLTDTENREELELGTVDAIKQDLKTRESIINEAQKAVKELDVKLNLFNDIVTFVNNEYENIVKLDIYFNSPLQLQETLDTLKNL